MVQTYSQEFLNETRNNIQDSPTTPSSPPSLCNSRDPTFLRVYLFPRANHLLRDIAVHTMVCKLMYREKLLILSSTVLLHRCLDIIFRHFFRRNLKLSKKFITFPEYEVSSCPNFTNTFFLWIHLITLHSLKGRYNTFVLQECDTNYRNFREYFRESEEKYSVRLIRKSWYSPEPCVRTCSKFFRSRYRET